MRTIWPFRHFGLKVMSIAIAVLLWLVVAGEETVERGLRVPLELQQFPEGLELLGELPATVDVRVRGASGRLSRVSPGDIVAVLDVRGARPGQRLFHLTPEDVRAPSGVDVIQVTPPTVAMVFENTASRDVPIAPAVDGKPAAGYMVGKITVDPASVEVVGPKSVIARVTGVTTEPVTVAGAEGVVREVVTVGALDPLLRLKTQRSATVTVQIVPAPLERTLRDRPVRLRNLEPHLVAAALPSEVNVTLRGSRDTLFRVDPDDVATYVDLSGLGSGQYTLTVRADSSRDAGVTRIEPITIQVQITSAKR